MDQSRIANKIAKVVIGDVKKTAAAESFSVIVDEIIWENVEDVWEKGEIGSSHIVMAKSNVGRFKSVKDAIHHVSQMTSVSEDNFAIFGGEDGRIEGEGFYDEHNNEVGDDNTFTEKWKRGEVKAWSGRISVYVKFAKVWEPSPDELKKESGLSEI